ncbi:MAG: 30S ribosomal protein S7 [Candidatus Pacearchaeota archaeon]
MKTETITQENEEFEIQEKKIKEKKSSDFKLFNLFDVSEIKINDPGIKRYINLEPKLLVKSYGRTREKFGKSKINLLELFANLIAVPGHRGKKHKLMTNWKSGKYSQNMKIVIKCLQIIEKKTNQNPIQVLVSAIENAAPRDGITVIEYGGAKYPQAVDISPSKRLTMTLKNIVQGSYDKSFNKKKKIEEALAEEIIKTYNNDADSYSLTKKKESEKQADSAR